MPSDQERYENTKMVIRNQKIEVQTNTTTKQKRAIQTNDGRQAIQNPLRIWGEFEWTGMETAPTPLVVPIVLLLNETNKYIIWRLSMPWWNSGYIMHSTCGLLDKLGSSFLSDSCIYVRPWYIYICIGYCSVSELQLSICVFLIKRL